MAKYLQLFNEWESKQELGDQERESISLLVTLLTKSEFITAELKEEIKVDSAEINDEVIYSSAQFLAWFQKIQQEMEEGQDGKHKADLQRLLSEKSIMQVCFI